MSKTEIYFTRLFDKKPYMVTIKYFENEINVEVRKEDITKPNNDGHGPHTIEILPILGVEKVFIGDTHKVKDRVQYNDINEPFGKGNSILLQVSGRNHILVGKYIIEFQSLGEIKEFHSPHIGRIPRPYAIDEYNNVYSFDNKVIIKNRDFRNEGYDEPYSYYDNIRNESNNDVQIGMEFYDRGLEDNTKCVIFPPIVFGRLSFSSKPEEEFQGLKYNGIFILENGEKKPLEKEEYLKMNLEFGKKQGLSPLNSKLLDGKYFV